MRAVLARAAELLSLPEDRQEHGFLMPALIWRFWKAHGGAERFGLPLAPSKRIGEITHQVFERAILEIHPGQANTPYLIQLAPLGHAALVERNLPSTVEPPSERSFPDSDRVVREAFLTYWEQSDGMLLLGRPLSEQFEGLAADGRWRTMQYFERAVLAYYPDDNSVRLDSLGWASLIRDRLQNSASAHSIR